MGRELSLILFNTIISAVLAGVIWTVWQDDGRRAPVGSQSGEEIVPIKPAGIIQHELKTAHLDEYEETINRPLFTKDRRPPVLASVENTEIRPSEIDKLVLTGIVTGPDKNLAILVNGVNQMEIRLQEGSAFQGWQLEQFASDEIVFSRQGEIRKLPLYKEDQPAATPLQGMVGAREALQQFRTRQQRTRKSQN